MSDLPGYYACECECGFKDPARSIGPIRHNDAGEKEWVCPDCLSFFKYYAPVCPWFFEQADGKVYPDWGDWDAIYCQYCGWREDPAEQGDPPFEGEWECPECGQINEIWHDIEVYYTTRRKGE